MKNFYFLLLLAGSYMGILTSCSDGDGQGPYIPTPPEVSIENLSTKNICSPGEIIELKAKLNNPLPTTFNWLTDGEKVSTDSIYRFSSSKPGTYQIVLTATNTDGIDSDSLIIEVNDGKFHFGNIKNWTGEGENRSALAIQWITGDNLLEPADKDVFFLAWGYRWKSTESPLGIDMLKAIAQNDPRLYVAVSGNYIVGFGYDGNNDGKIELTNENLHLTQDNFTDGFYELSGSDFDSLKPVDPEDYWLGGLYEAYATYWLGTGDMIPDTEEFEYSSLFVFNRPLENLSWDVWTYSPIDPVEMRNTFPFPHLIQAAEANK